MSVIDGVDHSVLDAYRTCEFATIVRDGTPLAWPTSPFRQPDGTLLVTTSIAFAQKALNVRREGRVSLLFSDPTASGLCDPVQIFVQGEAVCADEPTTSPAGTPLQTLRDCRASAARYLATRGLARPAVPWPQYRALARHPADRTRG